MTFSPKNDKIEKYLDDLAEDYKEMLYKALLTRSSSVGDYSITDLLMLDNEAKKVLLEDNRRSKRFQKVYLFSGIIYTFVGLFTLLFYYLLKAETFYEPMGTMLIISLTMILSGFLISVLAFFIPSFMKVNRSRAKNTKQKEQVPTKIEEYYVIYKWRELEGIVSELAGNDNIPPSQSKIDYLLEKKLITVEECRDLRAFLKMRNNFVHATDTTYSSEEIRISTNNISKIIEKLKKIL